MSAPTSALTKSLSAAEAFARLERRFSGVALTNGVSTVIDSILVDSYAAACWLVVLAKGVNRRISFIIADHQGTSAGDAATTAWTEFGGEDTGTVDVVLSSDLNGATTSQLLRLVALASSTGWTATAFRIPLLPAQP